MTILDSGVTQLTVGGFFERAIHCLDHRIPIPADSLQESVLLVQEQLDQFADSCETSAELGHVESIQTACADLLSLYQQCLDLAVYALLRRDSSQLGRLKDLFQEARDQAIHTRQATNLVLELLVTETQ